MKVVQQEHVAESVLDTFITAKIKVPHLRTRVLERDRLYKLLDDSSLRPLMVVTAPAGYGKTTLVADWARRAEPKRKLAWLSLDPEDNDRNRFFSYLVAAIRQTDPDFGSAFRLLTESFQPESPEKELTVLLNEFEEITEPTMLIIDDFHFIAAPQIVKFFSFLVRRIPGNLTIVLVGRRTPNIPLDRPRASGELSETNLQLLRFTDAEAEAFLRLETSLDAESLKVIMDRAEGWAAGLQLAALALRSPNSSALRLADTIEGFNGDHRLVIDFMAGQVVNNQSERLQLFLKRISILDRFSADLCSYVTELPDARELLDEVEHNNLFLVSLDERRQWYRFHTLFSDYLRRQVNREDVVRLHLRACEWYDQNGIGKEAVNHSLAAGDMELSASLVSRHADAMARRGEFPLILGWLERIPEAAVLSRPELCGYKAWLLYLGGRHEEAESYIGFFESEIKGQVEDTDGASAAKNFEEHHGTLLAFQSFLSLNRGKFDDACVTAERSLDVFGDSSSFFRLCALTLLGHAQRLTGKQREAIVTLEKTIDIAKEQNNVLLLLDAAGTLALLLSVHGRLNEAIELSNDVKVWGERPNSDPIPAAGLIQVPLGILLYEADQLDLAERELRQGVKLCRRVGMIYFALRGLLLMARIQLIKQDREGALATLAEAEKLAGQSENRHRLRQVRVASADLHFLGGDTRRALFILDDSDLDLSSPKSFQETLVSARALAAKNQRRKAIARLESAEAFAAKEGRVGQQISVLILLATFACQAGDRDLALEKLQRAVLLAEPGDYVRVFVEAGHEIRPLLRSIQDTAPGFIRSILDRVDIVDTSVEDGFVLENGEKLTETQIEVVKLLCRQLSNQQIAEDLGIKIGTAKWHLNQIYQKFGVRTRVEAIAYAQNNGLV